MLASTAEMHARSRIDGGGTILVVDDEDVIRDAAEVCLQLFGFGVMMAADGHEALEVFRTHADQIDVVLLDMTMPQLDGEEAFYALRRIQPEARVILSSGYQREDVLSRFEGLAGFLQKPYGPSALLQEITCALAVAPRSLGYELQPDVSPDSKPSRKMTGEPSTAPTSGGGVRLTPR